MEEELKHISAHDVNVSTGGFVGNVVTSEFEADALIKGRFQAGKCQLILSSDGDFPMDLGDDYLVVSIFTGQSLSISCTLKETLTKCSVGVDASITVHCGYF